MNFRDLYKYLRKIRCITLITLIFLGLSSQTNVYAQNITQVKKWMKEGSYGKALNVLNNNDKTAKNPDHLLLRAICYYHTDQIDNCLTDLKLHESFYTGDALLWKYSGLCFIKKEQYEDASKYLKKYLSLSKSTQEDYQKIILEVRRCGKAQQIARKNLDAFVENAGSIVNSSENEWRPVYSPNFQDRLYYSSNKKGSTGGKRNQKGLVDDEEGQYYADMYYSDFIEGNWSEPTTFLPLLNTPKHDLIGDFNSEGNILYYGLTSDFVSYDYYSDTFSTEYLYDKIPVKVALPLQGEFGDKDVFIFNDSLLFFASRHLPGYGGYDLYYSKFTGGKWQNPVNLGPDVNTTFDEISPFITNGGNTLYFSSDRIDGFGGYDIFWTEYHNNTKKWKEAVNMGKPVNSPWDENHFLLAADGMSAVFTSNKEGGYGGSDIYITYFKEQKIEQLLFVDQPSFLDSVQTKSIVAGDISDNKIQKKLLRLPSLYYVTNDDLLSAQNIGLLSKLSENLLIYPDTRLTIYAHSNVESNRDMELYLTLKKAETISGFLIQKGVDPYRIVLKACGSSFPISQPFINGIASNVAEKNNKRIDFSLISISADINVTEERTNLSGVYLDERYELFRKAEDTLVFRLLIAQTQQMFRSELLNHYKEIFIEKTQNQPTNHYLLGQFAAYDEALKTKKILQQQYNVNAAMIPYYKGKPLARELYGYMSKTMPELQKFVLNEE